MSDTNRVVIIGGHGKIALLATGKLKSSGYDVDSVIRNPEQRDDVQDAGGNPVVLDVESASVDDLDAAFAGATAIVFAAGAGGGNPDRTFAVDYGAATCAMVAADEADVRRFVMVSYVRAATDVDGLDRHDAFYPYARAKHDADGYLRQSALDYTILGPGSLTTEPASGKIQLTDAMGRVEGGWPDDRKVTSRDNVAEVIAHVIKTNAAMRQTVNFYDGDTPIAEALS